MDTFLALAHDLADAAGAAIRPYFGAHGEVATKADDSPVTAVDRAAETAMRTLIAGRFPQHGVFGEEFGQEGTWGWWLGAGKNPASPQPPASNPHYTWVLDPIDGTRAFIAGKKEWGTLIALCENGVPILGVLDQPITGERWIGARGMATQYSASTAPSVIARSDSDVAIQRGASATQNTLKSWIAAASQETPRNDGTHTLASLSTTSRRYFTPPQARAFMALAAQCGEVIEDGDCYAYGLLARGLRDIVVDARLKPYDILALVPIIEGSGKTITAWDGAPITLTHFSTALATATPALHTAALKLLS